MHPPAERLKEKKTVAAHLEKTQMKREFKKREMSPYVISRWYRPPEIILLEQDYNTPVDIWSSACIVSEMLTCS